MFIPRFAKFPANPFPVCALCNFLFFYFFIFIFIFFFDSCRPILCRCIFQSKPYFFFFVFFFFFSFFSLFLGPMVLVLDILMFFSKFFLLILLYLATKDVPFGKFTLSGTARLPSIIFFQKKDRYNEFDKDTININPEKIQQIHKYINENYQTCTIDNEKKKRVVEDSNLGLVTQMHLNYFEIKYSLQGNGT